MKPKPVTKIKAIPWLLAFVALMLVAVPASSDAQVPIKLWHSYRGRNERRWTDGPGIYKTKPKLAS